MERPERKKDRRVLRLALAALRISVYGKAEMHSDKMGRPLGKCVNEEWRLMHSKAAKMHGDCSVNELTKHSY